MRNNEFMMALNALCHQRDLSKDVVFDAIETALQAAYRRDFEHDPNIEVEMDRTTGEARVFVDWRVVDEVEDDSSQLALDEAQAKFGDHVAVGDTLREERTPRNFGRIAAQTAKQVILQRIREAERDRAFHEYSSREGEIVLGTVQSVDSRNGLVRLSLGKVEAVMPVSEQLPNERYRVGQRVRGFVSDVNRVTRGPQITLSRTHKEMLRRLLEMEVPEIANGTVEVRAIAREPGARSKVAVAAMQPGVDPVGACVGMKGIRIQNIVNELNGEKIDVVAWSPDESIYVANALSPAKVMETLLDPGNEEGRTAVVVVPDRQLSLAIGKEGQNARLAAKLTGWRIDIKNASEMHEERDRLAARHAAYEAKVARQRQEEAERLAAAEALLAEAQAAPAADAVTESVAPTAADKLAFDELAPAEEAVAAPADEGVSKVDAAPEPVQKAAPTQAQPAPDVVEKTPPAKPQPAPASMPEQRKPAPKPTPKAAPQPQPSYDDWLDEEDDYEEEEVAETPQSPLGLPFYTLNERGEAQSLDETLERNRRDKKKKSRKGQQGPGKRSSRGGWEDDDSDASSSSRKRGKPSRSPRPWSEDKNW